MAALHKAHRNLFIPSTLSGSNFDANWLPNAQIVKVKMFFYHFPKSLEQILHQRKHMYISKVWMKLNLKI